MFKTISWKCTADSILYQKEVEDERIFKFLIGLNPEFDEVRGRVISRQPLPALVEVRREESRRHVMLGPRNSSGMVESSALAVPGHGKDGGKKTSPKDNGDKPRVWCDHCNKPRHTRETCWKLHGKPTNWKGSHEGKFNKSGTTPASANHATPGTLSQEQIGQLLKLLDANSGSSNVSNLTLTQTGELASALKALHQNSPWILDSGATHHMTSLEGFQKLHY